MNWSKFPSAMEWQGPYNHQRAPEVEAVTTVSELPPLTFDEFVKVAAATRDCILRDAAGHGVGEEEMASLRRDVVEFNMYDRTVWIHCLRFEMIRPTLIESIQREVLAAWPLWRIEFQGETPETSVVVYPQVARVGCFPPEADLQSSLDAVTRREYELREPREGPKRRQLEEVKRRLPAAVKSLTAERPFAIVAAFDNSRGNPDRATVWLLSPDDMGIWKARVEGRGKGGPSYPVERDGALGKPGYVADGSDLWLTQWVFPREFGDHLIVEHEEDGRCWTVEFDSATIIRDAVLKAAEQRGRTAP